MKEVLDNLKFSYYSKYGIGEVVYLKTDEENKPRIIISISFYPTSTVYKLSNKVDESYHYEMEFSYEKNQFYGL